MELVTLASPGERETGAALMAHYRQWHREQFPGGTAGPLNDEDLQAAYLGGFHLALSLVVYLAPPPRRRAPRWPDRAAAAFTRFRHARVPVPVRSASSASSSATLASAASRSRVSLATVR